MIEQLREAFSYDTAPRYLIFDRDTSFNPAMVRFVKAKVVALPRVGGLHHRHEWCEAA